MNNPLYSKFVEKKSLSTPKRRMKIVNAVLAVHLAILFLPLSYFLLMDHLSKLRKKDTVVVRLVELPKDGVKTVKKSARRPRRAAVKKKKTAPKKRVQKKVQPKPSPKKSTVKPVKKTVPVPAKKVVKTVAKPVKPAKPEYKPPALPDDLEVITSKDLKRVPEEDDENEDIDDDGEVGATYQEQLVSALYKLWLPPSNKLLNGRKPKVHVKIRFNRDGRVIEKKIIKKSGFIYMDRSVEELLKSLVQLPAPPPGEPTEIEFLFVPLE